MTFKHPLNDEWPKAQLGRGTWELEVWDDRLSPKYGWQCYYGAYMFHGERLSHVLNFAREHCFFCRDLNDEHHTEIRLRNIRTGMTMPFSLLFVNDPEYRECQKNRRARYRIPRR